jgi:hypothetical protein
VSGAGCWSSGCSEHSRPARRASFRLAAAQHALPYLLHHRNEAPPRETLIDALWPEDPPMSAAHALDVYASRRSGSSRAPTSVSSRRQSYNMTVHSPLRPQPHSLRRPSRPPPRRRPGGLHRTAAATAAGSCEPVTAEHRLRCTGTERRTPHYASGPLVSGDTEQTYSGAQTTPANCATTVCAGWWTRPEGPQPWGTGKPAGAARRGSDRGPPHFPGDVWRPICSAGRCWGVP